MRLNSGGSHDTAKFTVVVFGDDAQVNGSATMNPKAPTPNAIELRYERVMGAFGVDVPVVSKQGSYPGGEGFGVSEGFQVAVEAQLAYRKLRLRAATNLPRKTRLRCSAWSRRPHFRGAAHLSAQEPTHSD